MKEVSGMSCIQTVTSGMETLPQQHVSRWDIPEEHPVLDLGMYLDFCHCLLFDFCIPIYVYFVHKLYTVMNT